MTDNSKEIITEEGYVLKPYPEEKEEVTIGIPRQTYQALEKIAERKDFSLNTLIKSYISQGMRQDLTEKESSELAVKRLKSRKKFKEKKEEVDLAA